jgi:hypothetical protein
MSVPVKIYRSVTYQEGFTPSNPNVTGDPVINPLNPNGEPVGHNPVTIGSPANGLSITDDQVLTYDGSTIPTAAVIGRYEIDTSGTTAPVGTKDIRYNNATQISATQLFISDITEDNIDVDLFLSLIKQGSALVIQDRDDHLNYQTYEVSGTPTFASATWTFPVTFKDSGGTGTTGFANNHKVLLSALSSGSSGSKWTDVGANIYRDSAVAIGRTTIPANATFAVQNKSSANNIINLINNANTTSVLTVNDSGHTAIVGTGFGFNYFNVLDGATSLFSVLGQGGSSSVQIGASNFSAKSATFTSASAGAGITFFDIRNNSGTSFLSLRTDNLLFINIATVYSNGANFSFGTTTGTKIGTTTSQKLGFWNATPIVQPTTAIAESAFVENAGGTAVNDDSTFDGYTLRQVVKALRDAGLLA